MDLIRDHLHHCDESLPIVELLVPRLNLTKRRWRATAPDGREFGFDLERRLHDGDFFYESSTARYRVKQDEEAALLISLPPDAGAAARLGWMIGNLHFPLSVTQEGLLVADDPALRQLCDREGLPYQTCQRVFHPLSGGHSHSPQET